MRGEERLREVMKAKQIHGVKDRIELQDIIGQATMRELKDFETGLDRNDRRMFLWIVFTVLDVDLAMSIFEETSAANHVRRMVEKAEDRVSYRLDQLDDRERIFEENKRAVHRRLKKMRLQVVRAGNKADTSSHKCGEALWKLGNRDRQIKQLRGQIEELEKELEEYVVVKQAVAILMRG